MRLAMVCAPLLVAVFVVELGASVHVSGDSDNRDYDEEAEVPLADPVDSIAAATASLAAADALSDQHSIIAAAAEAFAEQQRASGQAGAAKAGSRAAAVPKLMHAVPMPPEASVSLLSELQGFHTELDRTKSAVSEQLKLLAAQEQAITSDIARLKAQFQDAEQQDALHPLAMKAASIATAMLKVKQARKSVGEAEEIASAIEEEGDAAKVEPKNRPSRARSVEQIADAAAALENARKKLQHADDKLVEAKKFEVEVGNVEAQAETSFLTTVESASQRKSSDAAEGKEQDEQFFKDVAHAADDAVGQVKAIYPGDEEVKKAAAEAAKSEKSKGGGSVEDMANSMGQTVAKAANEAMVETPSSEAAQAADLVAAANKQADQAAREVEAIGEQAQGGLRPGDRVVIQGLKDQRADKFGICVDWKDEPGQWLVELEDKNDQVLVQLENLKSAQGKDASDPAALDRLLSNVPNAKTVAEAVFDAVSKQEEKANDAHAHLAAGAGQLAEQSTKRLSRQDMESLKSSYVAHIAAAEVSKSAASGRPMSSIAKDVAVAIMDASKDVSEWGEHDVSSKPVAEISSSESHHSKSRLVHHDPEVQAVRERIMAKGGADPSLMAYVGVDPSKDLRQSSRLQSRARLATKAATANTEHALRSVMQTVEP